MVFRQREPVAPKTIIGVWRVGVVPIAWTIMLYAFVVVRSRVDVAHTSGAEMYGYPGFVEYAIGWLRLDPIAENENQ